MEFLNQNLDSFCWLFASLGFANPVIDSYYPMAFEALLLVNGLKNVFAFGFSYGVVPWIIHSGYQDAFWGDDSYSMWRYAFCNTTLVLWKEVEAYFF